MCDLEGLLQGAGRSYYQRRVAGLLAQVSLEEARKLALEMIIAEMHVKSLLKSGCLSDRERAALEDALKDIDCAKNMLYRAYRLGLIRAGRRRGQ
ncbi:MAG: hypothetical protein QXQ60_07165 [Thermofilum sp.]